MADRAGTATISPQGEFEAGSFQEFVLTYTAGYFGVDDTGSLKIVHRFASDMGKPQFSDPAAPNYVTAETGNGAVLTVEYDGKRNVRPWDKTLFIRVVKGFLREGDQIVVRFGDRRHGCPGMRVQTFNEPTFEFKVLVDPWATYTFIELPQQPTISVVAGPARAYKLVGPTLVRIGDTFRIGFKGEDKWGNPSHLVEGRFKLHASMAVEGLPDFIDLRKGSYATVLANLRCLTTGELIVRAMDEHGVLVATSNPLKVEPDTRYRSYWADLHGQSEETIGTNSARELVEFARDRAFLDVMSHQGNDFQITLPFWKELNCLTREFNEDGRFIIFPGYEWSGNTGLGGDRNVLFASEGRTIHRSHHALVEDLADVSTDAHTARDLFDALSDEDCLVFAHIGGRYADIKLAHDVRIERSIEIHSDWGTFDWLLEDAFDQGYRVGILANSDGHKGRHGASHPGASLFGAYGGLSCLLASELTRSAIFDALRSRRHYATTGNRVHLEVSATVQEGADLYNDDPNMGGAIVARVTHLDMGNIARTAAGKIALRVAMKSSSPIERIEIRNRGIVKTFRPQSTAADTRRLRVIWEGSEYRGRGRQTVWDGNLAMTGNGIDKVVPINWWNIDKKLEQVDREHLQWAYLTTGGFGGIEIWLDRPDGGEIRLEAGLVKTNFAIDMIDETGIEIDAGGLGRKIRVYRLPEKNPMLGFEEVVEIPLRHGQDNPVYVRAVTEDGHTCWSSPIYLI
jgi:hypothetical protein